MDLSRRTLFATGAAAAAAGLLSPDLAWAGSQADWALAVGDVEADLAPRPLRLIHGSRARRAGRTLDRNGPGKVRAAARPPTWFDATAVRAFRIGEDGGRACRPLRRPPTAPAATRRGLWSRGLAPRGGRTRRSRPDAERRQHRHAGAGGQLLGAVEARLADAARPAPLATEASSIQAASGAACRSWPPQGRAGRAVLNSRSARRPGWSSADVGGRAVEAATPLKCRAPATSTTSPPPTASW